VHADCIKECLSRFNIAHKVVLLVTDNPTSMQLARRLVVETEGFQNILEIRCVNSRDAMFGGL
jgi:hypothetical protein